MVIDIKFTDGKVSYCPETNSYRVFNFTPRKFYFDTDTRRTIYCHNCNSYGHGRKNCDRPKCSYGIIIFRITDCIELLMVKRLWSYYFTDLIMGRYDLNDPRYVKLLLAKLRPHEKQYVLEESFENLWNMIWVWGTKSKSEYKQLELRFEQLRQFIQQNAILLDISPFPDDQWEFPKGRRENHETDLETACREVYEETNLQIDDYILYDQVKAFHEAYTSINGKDYASYYYLAEIKDPSFQPAIITEIQRKEIRDIRWVRETVLDHHRVAQYTIRCIRELKKGL